MSAEIRIVLIEKAPIVVECFTTGYTEWVPVRKCCGENEFLFRMNKMRLVRDSFDRPASEYYVRVGDKVGGFNGLIHKSLITTTQKQKLIKNV